MARVWFIAVALGWCAAFASGQDSVESVVDPVNGRTAAELVAMGFQQNDELLAGRSQIAAAEGGAQQAGLRPNPMVELSGMKGATGPMNSFMLGGSLPLELYHRKERRVEVAQGEVEVAELMQVERERQLRAMIESKFGELLAAARDLQFTGDLLALNREALRLTEARAEQGAIPELDADLLRVEVNRIDALRLDLESRLGVELLELKSLVGLPPEEPLRVRGSLEPEALAVTQDEAIGRALENRPDLLAARAMESVASASLRQAETEGKLDASVSASYQRSDFGFPIRGFAPNGELRRVQEVFHQLSLGVSVTLPVRNRNQGAMAAAVAEIEAARRRREYAELIARREVAAAFLAREKARESLDVYRERVLGQAQQNLQVIRRVYELGRNQLLDVIAEQRRLIDIEMGYTEALNRFYQATVRLRIAGNLD